MIERFRFSKIGVLFLAILISVLLFTAGSLTTYSHLAYEGACASKFFAANDGFTKQMFWVFLGSGAFAALCLGVIVFVNSGAAEDLRRPNGK